MLNHDGARQYLHCWQGAVSGLTSSDGARFHGFGSGEWGEDEPDAVGRSVVWNWIMDAAKDIDYSIL